MVLELEAELFEDEIGIMIHKMVVKENEVQLLNFELGKQHQIKEEELMMMN